MITYLLFAGDDYYPVGGWGDFVGRFDSLEEAKEFIVQNKKSYDWVEIAECNNLNFRLVYRRNFNSEELNKKIKKLFPAERKKIIQKNTP